MRGILDFQTASDLVDRRIRVLVSAQNEHELSESDADELAHLYVVRERVQRAGIRAVEAALDEIEVA